MYEQSLVNRNPRDWYLCSSRDRARTSRIVSRRNSPVSGAVFQDSYHLSGSLAATSAFRFDGAISSPLTDGVEFETSSLTPSILRFATLRTWP